MHHLYWIHLEEHTDPFTEGYIGVSTQPKVRFRQHTTDTAAGAGSQVVRRIAQEHGVDVLRHTNLASFTTREEARIEERNYRPKTNIGWNIWVGGGVSPDCTGRVDSIETRLQRAQSNIRTKSTRSYVCPFKGKTDHHDAETRALIGSYHKGKTISEAHRKSASEKMSREKSPVAKSIDLLNIETQELHKFLCLKSASEELSINYSALRSAFRQGQEVVYRKWKILY